MWKCCGGQRGGGGCRLKKSDSLYKWLGVEEVMMMISREREKSSVCSRMIDTIGPKGVFALLVFHLITTFYAFQAF